MTEELPWMRSFRIIVEEAKKMHEHSRADNNVAFMIPPEKPGELGRVAEFENPLGKTLIFPLSRFLREGGIMTIEYPREMDVRGVYKDPNDGRLYEILVREINHSTGKEIK